MAELEDDLRGDLTEALGESDDVRRIKEEWTKLQMEADGRKEKDELESKNGGAAEEHDGRKHPPSRLPSLDSMVGRIPSIPSMEISTGLGKK